MLNRAMHWIGPRNRKILAWEFFVFVLVYLALAATLATSYQQCAADREGTNSRQEQPGPKDNAATFFVCEIATIDANSTLLTAVATVFIAAFTLTLWLATTDQGRLTREAIDDAKRSSERQLRAYVHFAMKPTQPITTSSEKNRLPRFSSRTLVKLLPSMLSLAGRSTSSHSRLLVLSQNQFGRVSFLSTFCTPGSLRGRPLSPPTAFSPRTNSR